MIVPDANGGFLADARADLDELAAAIGVELAAGEPGEDVDTIGGLVFSLVGRIPVRGELVAASRRLRVRDPRRRSAPHQTRAHPPSGRRRAPETRRPRATASTPESPSSA